MSADDKVQNKGEELKGRAKEALGDATGNEQWQAEGKAERAKPDCVRNDGAGWLPGIRQARPERSCGRS